MADLISLMARDIYFIDERNKIVLSAFKTPYGHYYLRLGKQFYSAFDEEWLHTKEGISIPMNIYTTATLFDSLVSILAVAEVKTYLKRFVDVNTPESESTLT